MDQELNNKLINNLQEINTQEKFQDFLIDMLTKHKLNYRNINTILKHRFRNNIDIYKIVDIFRKLDIKVCRNFENCKNIDGPILAFNDFYKKNNTADNLETFCKKCRNYKGSINQRKNNQEAIQLIKTYFSLNNNIEREKFIIELYTRKYFSYLNVKGITNLSIKKIIEICEKFDVKKCEANENCVNQNGACQSRSNFSKSKNQPDGLNRFCTSCVNKKRNLPAKYDTYAERISFIDSVRRHPKDQKILQVKCKYCGKWTTPTRDQINTRIYVLRNKTGVECNIYCSDECKEKCPVFRSRTDYQLNINPKVETRNRMQIGLRKFFVKEFGEPNICEICGETFNSKDLILHHKIPVAEVHIFEADIDNLIWVCQNCHQKIHSKQGCKVSDLRFSNICG